MQQNSYLPIFWDINTRNPSSFYQIYCVSYCCFIMYDINQGAIYICCWRKFIECCTGGPWFNKTIHRHLHGPIFDELFFTAHQDRYGWMCGVHAYNRKNDKSTDVTDFGGGRPQPEYSTKTNLVYLYVSINYIETWLYVLGGNSWRCCAYEEKTKERFKKIPTEILTPTLEYSRRKCLTLLTDIGSDWFINTMRNPKHPINNTRLSLKKTITRQTKMWIESYVWPLERLEIPNWLEKMKYAMPLKRNTKKTKFFISYNKFFLKYGTNYNHWVGHSVINSVDAVFLITPH